MLPTEPKSYLPVIPIDKLKLSSSYKAMLNKNTIRQFASKTGGLIMKHPFAVLVIGSLGIHAAFVLLTPNPLKTTEQPPEIVVSTLPVVKLPPQPSTLNIKTNKSVLDNLFVKPTTNSLNKPASKLPISNAPLSFSSSFDYSNLETLEDFPPASTDFSFPLQNNSRFDETPTEQRPTPAPVSKTPPPSNKINKPNPVKTATNTTNTSDLKPEFQNNGLKDNVTTTPPAATKDAKDTKNSKDSSNGKGVVIGASNGSETAQNEKEVKDLKYIFTTDKKIADLYSKNLIKDTQIAPPSVIISNPLERLEKGVEWIPPKVTNIAGKKGTVTYLLLVNPVGKVETRFLQSSGDKELDNLVREAVEKYSFKPIEDPQSGRYRLVKAEYKFS